ncbi:MAG: PorP/SprF family type IX secretion system membrane protein [Bacteroidales bacterium]|nr:PorP/SprF family type IX secretion system membrane protein [Bacteroidales bacterium]
MKTLLKISIIVLFLFITNKKILCQDPFFSMFFENPTIVNPANAGLLNDIRICMQYRNQWKSITTPFTTTTAGIDGRVKLNMSSNPICAGLLILNDKSGDSKLSYLNVTTNVGTKVIIDNTQYISIGIAPSFNQRKIDFSGLKWDKQYNGLYYDSSLPTGESYNTNSYSFFDIGTGVTWNYGRGASTLSSNDIFGAQVGLCISHLNKPNKYFIISDRNFTKFTINSAISYGIKNSNIQLTPMFLFIKQGAHRLIYLGNLFKYMIQESSKYTDYVQARLINTGIFVKVGDAFVLMFQIEWEKIVCSVSYDVNISSLTKLSKGRGAWEIALRYMPQVSNKSSRLL